MARLRGGPRTLAEPQAGRDRDSADDGWRLLSAGRAREAGEVFGRVLLDDPENQEAAAGLSRAEAQTREEERTLESTLAEVEQALATGDSQRARELIGSLGASGSSHDRLVALRERLDDRAGRVGAHASRPDPVQPEAPPLPRSHGSRGLVVAGWAVVLTLLGTSLATSWEGLMGRLMSRPVPTVAPAASAPEPLPSGGEAVLVEARQRVEQGELRAALALLETVSPEDPAYPFARRMRREVEVSLLDRGYGE